MESFRRAYRDPKSPLTPLTPLASNAAFNFNLGGDDSLKPFINVITGTPRCSPTVPRSGIKCVNPNKYTKPQPTQLNTRNVSTKATDKARKLSPRFAANMKPEVDMKQVFQVADHSDSCLMSKSDINNNSRQTCAYSSAASSNVRGTSSYGYKNEPGRQSSSYDSSLTDSNLSNGSSISFESSTSTSSSCQDGNRRRKPPKLVLNDTALDVPELTMSSVFNWVWNRLSPMKNPSIYELLSRVGMQKYWNIFQKEEIVDLDVFSTLTMDDLKSIGIKDTNDCVKILKSVAWAIDFLSDLLNFKKP
ncbi:uncharacterized protein LOC101455957 [Ceratitis capitata]|uniref:uncharacterized protein LOC101455957 n=1 Tax=Ceratitis capitata TaxID=7213 RepID=UPI000329A45D|nr:uncharacterized protein LOC101455957 [Ceratitis capitata]